MNTSPTIIVPFAVTTVLLAVNLLWLWLHSGVARARSGLTINAEDGLKYGKPVSDQDPAPVAKVLRAHANAAANIYPFLFVGLAYVLLNGNPLFATVVFAVFCVSRFGHSIAYLGSLQPLRSICYGVSFLALLVLMGAVVVRAFEVSAVT